MISMVRTPRSRQQIQFEANELVSVDGSELYAVSTSGIPLFATAFLSESALSQQLQYDGMVDKYVENLGYPHTQEYMAYLDMQLFEEIPTESQGTVAELCCGGREAARLLIGRMEQYVGVDVSSGFLNIARPDMSENNHMLLRGYATVLPLDDQIFDNVFMLGGIHHVPDKLQLFTEVHRIPKPGGRFYFRKPVDDFLLWRGIRKLVYRLSSALDHNTEAPLRKVDTEADQMHVELQLSNWQTYGFFGFAC